MASKLKSCCVVCRTAKTHRPRTCRVQGWRLLLLHTQWIAIARLGACSVEYERTPQRLSLELCSQDVIRRARSEGDRQTLAGSHFPSRSREEKELHSEQQYQRAPPHFLDGRHKRVCAARLSDSPHTRQRVCARARVSVVSQGTNHGQVGGSAVGAPTVALPCGGQWRGLGHTLAACARRQNPSCRDWRSSGRRSVRSKRHSTARSEPDCPRALAAGTLGQWMAVCARPRPRRVF